MSVKKKIELSSKLVHGLRLRQERDRLNLTQGQLAEMVGVAPLTVGNYENGKRSPDGEYLAALDAIGIDPLYVLTGKRQQASEALSPEVDALLMERGILTGQGLREDQVWISAIGLMWLLHLYEVRRKRRDQDKPTWGRALLQELAELDGEDMRAIHLQCITLQGHDKQQTYRQLLVYEVSTPVHSPWSIAPDKTLQMRYELDAIWADLPIDFHAVGVEGLQPVLALQIGEQALLLRGDVLTIEP